MPVGQSKRFARALAERIGTDRVTLLIISGAGHMDPVFFEQGHLNDVLDWLDQQLK